MECILILQSWKCITRLGENRQFVLTSTVGWRVRKSIGKSWNINPFGDTSFLRCILEMSILEICFSRKQRVNKLNNLPLNDLSIRNQDVVIFWYFTFSFEKATEREINVVLQLPLGPSVDSLAVPWIAAFPESHTNANVPVRKSLEIYLQFETRGFRVLQKMLQFVGWVKPPLPRFFRLPQVKLIRSSSTFCAQALEICGRCTASWRSVNGMGRYPLPISHSTP